MDLLQGAKYKYCSTEYNYEFTLLNVSGNILSIMITDSYRIFKVKRNEVLSSIEMGTSKAIKSTDDS